MKIPRFYHPDTRHEVHALLLEKYKPGEQVTSKALAIAREIVWARHALETIEWKRQYMTIAA